MTIQFQIKNKQTKKHCCPFGNIAFFCSKYPQFRETQRPVSVAELEEGNAINSHLSKSQTA